MYANLIEEQYVFYINAFCMEYTYQYKQVSYKMECVYV